MSQGRLSNFCNSASDLCSPVLECVALGASFGVWVRCALTRASTQSDLRCLGASPWAMKSVYARALCLALKFVQRSRGYEIPRGRFRCLQRKLAYRLRQHPMRCGGGELSCDEVAARLTYLQGLTLVHFQAQPKPFLTQNTPETPPTPPSHLLHTPYIAANCTPYSIETAHVEPKSGQVQAPAYLSHPTRIRHCPRSDALEVF